MATTHKKVIVRKMDRDTVNGYVSNAFVTDGKLELMNTAGNVVTMDLRDIKGVYFVREFGDTETLTRKTFTSRPRVEGLWVRLRFRDNEVIEGMMPNDLLAGGRRRLFDHSARHPVQYAADLRAALGAGGDDRDRRDRREIRPPRPPSRRHAPGADVPVGRVHHGGTEGTEFIFIFWVPVDKDEACVMTRLPLQTAEKLDVQRF